MIRRTLLAWSLAAPLAAAASAHHVVWLEFFDGYLDLFPSVSGHPPNAADHTLIRGLVMAELSRRYAPFDVYFSLHQPNTGRYSHMRIVTSSTAIYGTVGCNNGCTGIGSWDDEEESLGVVYVGSIAKYLAIQSTELAAPNDTPARIARAIARVLAHELGHLVDLEHCDAADDRFSLGEQGYSCTQIYYQESADVNLDWHVMSTGVPLDIHAAISPFFSVHASRRVLYGNLQPRNHALPLPNLNGGAGWSDLLYGRYVNGSVVRFYGRLSTSSAFGSLATWSNDAGAPGDLYLTGDVDGDGRDDLVYGRILDSSTVRWYVRRSQGNGFGGFETWSPDTGAVGDLFRLGDVDGDGDDDLVLGRSIDDSTMRWYVAKSDSASGEFGTGYLWKSDAGDRDDLFFVADVAENVSGGAPDGRADLVVISRSPGMGIDLFNSTGNIFDDTPGSTVCAGCESSDLVFVADVDTDARAELVHARMLSDHTVRWWVCDFYGYHYTVSNGGGGGWSSCGLPGDLWKSDAGSAGDLYRLGDADGDDRADLFYGRAVDLDGTTTPLMPGDLATIRWYGRLVAANDNLGGQTTWRDDAGDEGDVFP